MVRDAGFEPATPTVSRVQIHGVLLGVSNEAPGVDGLLTRLFGLGFFAFSLTALVFAADLALPPRRPKAEAPSFSRSFIVIFRRLQIYGELKRRVFE